MRTIKECYLVRSLVHVSLGVHLNSSPRVPSLDKILLCKLKTRTKLFSEHI